MPKPFTSVVDFFFAAQKLVLPASIFAMTGSCNRFKETNFAFNARARFFSSDLSKIPKSPPRSWFSTIK